MTTLGAGRIAAACAFGILAVAPRATPADRIPVTTSSEEARQLYLKGRDLSEKLRATDARALFQQAAAKDPGFALAQVGLANLGGLFETSNISEAAGGFKISVRGGRRFARGGRHESGPGRELRLEMHPGLEPRQHHRSLRQPGQPLAADGMPRFAAGKSHRETGAEKTMLQHERLFDRPNKQDTRGGQQALNLSENLPLRCSVEINEKVAAEDEVVDCVAGQRLLT